MPLSKLKLSTEEKELIKLNGLFFFSSSLAGIFVNLFLFQLGGFKAVVYYGLVNLSFLYLIYLLSGYFLKKYSSKTLIRTGLLLFAIFYGMLLILGERSINYLILLGGVAGLANGFYWSGNNLTQYIATHEYSRSEYFGKLNFFMNIGSAIGPILGGSIIYLFNLYSIKFLGYITIFLIVFILFLITFFVTNKLQSHTGSKFSFLEIINHRRKISWKIVLIQQFLYGLFDVSFSIFSSILMFLFLKQELILGAVNTTSTLVFALANIGAVVLLRKNKYSFFVGSVISSFGLFLFGLQQNWLGIFGLVFINNMAIPLLNITTSKGVYDTIDSVRVSWERKYHFLVERDSILGLARILTYVCMLFFFTPQNQESIAKAWIRVIPVFPLLIGLLQLYKDHSFVSETSA